MEKFPTIRGPLVHGSTLEENKYVPNQDEIRIAADVHRLDDPRRYSVLSSIAPYPKEIRHWPRAVKNNSPIKADNSNLFLNLPGE